MFYRLCIILLFVLTVSTPAVSGEHQSESEKRSLADATNTVKLQEEETENRKETLSAVKLGSDTEEEEETSAFDDEHG